MGSRFDIFRWPGRKQLEGSARSPRRSRRKNDHGGSSLLLEGLEDKRMLAVTVTPNFDGLGGLLFFDDATGPTTNQVSLYMQDATGSSLYYTITGGSLTTTPPVPLTGVTSVQFLDSAAGVAATGDTLEIYGFGGSSFAVSGKSIVFGGALPITTLNVENFVLDGLTSRATMGFDGVGVTGNVTARNASVTTVAGTSAYQIGGNLSIDTNTLQLNGALSASGATSLVLSGGIIQSVASPITTSTLTVVNSIAGDVLLTNSRNAVGSVAITNLADGGNVEYTDADSVTVGVTGVGITANNAAAVNVISGGILTISSPILAGSGSVYLVAANGISQAASAQIVAHSLTFRNGQSAPTGSNNVNLPGIDNCIDIVAGINYANNGSITINAVDGLSIGPGVDGILGLTASNGVISVTAGDSLSIDNDVLAQTGAGLVTPNGGSILLSANNGVRQSGGGRLLGRSLAVTNKTLGPVALDAAANDVSFLTVTNNVANGTVAYADANDFAVGAGGITTTNGSGAVTLIAQGSVTQVGAIITRTLSLENRNAAGGSLLLPLTTNDVAFFNATNAFADGTIRYTDANAFNVGADGIDAAGNTVFLAARGAVAQDGDIVAGVLDIQQTGAGGVDFTRATNSIPTLTGAIGTGTLAVTTQTPLSVGTAGIAAANATVNLTSSGSLTQSGAISASALNATNTSSLSGDIIFDAPANAIAAFTASNPYGGGIVTLVNSTGTAIGAAGIVAPGNDVALTVNGGLSQAGKVIADTLTVTNTSTTTGAITLDLATNDVTSFGANNAAAGAATSYRDASGFDVTGVSGQGAVSLASVGDLTQSGAITSPGLLTASNLSGTSGSVVLTNAGNRVTSLAGGNANADATKLPVFQYTDADDVVIGAAGVTALVSDVTLAATGNLTQDATSGAIRSRSLDVANSSTTRGLVTLTNAKNDTALFSATNLFGKGSVSYTDANSVTLGSKGIAADKNAVTLNVSGNILQDVASGTIVARSLALNNTNASLGQIALGNAKNDVDLLAISNAAVTAKSTFTDTDGLTIDTAGINAAAGAGNVVLNTAGTLDQLGAITAREFTANTTAGNVLLTNATNDIKLFNASNTNATGTVSYTDASDVGIGSAGIAAAGNTVNLTFATALSQDVTTGGAITAGTLNLASTKLGATTSLITPANNVATLTANYTGNGGTLTYVDADSLAIGQLTSSTVGVQATGAAVSLTVGGAGTLTQTGTVQAASLNVASSTGNVDLSLAGNDVASLTGSSTSGNIKYRDASALIVGDTGVVTAGNVDLTTVGALSQSGKVVANALTVTNTSTTTGAITLDLATNDVTSFGANNAAAGAATSYRDASGFDVTGVSGQGAVSLASVGDLTQSGAITSPGLLTASNLSGTSGSVVLTNAGNRVTSLAGGNANADATKLPVFQYTDADDVVIGAAGVTALVSDVTLAATGNLTQDATSGAIRSRSLDVANSSTTRGLVTLTNAKNDTALFSATNLFGKGSVSYTDANSVTLGSKGIAADKNAVTLNVSGNILQDVASGTIVARSLALNNTNASLGQIALGNAKNDVDLLAISNAAVTAKSTFTDTDGLTIDTAGINAAAGAGNVVLNTAGTLDQLGAITAREFTANTTAGNVLLTNATNDIKLFNASNTNATGTVSYTDASDVGIGSAGIAAAGNTVNLTFATALSQDVTTGGAITAGTLNLASTKLGATTSLITPANNVATLTANYTGNGGTLTYVDADSLAIGQLTSSTVGVQATGAAVSLTVGGAGTLTQTGTVQAASLNVASSTGNVDLSLAGNDVASLTGSSTSGNIKYRDASALIVGDTGVVTAGNVDLTTVGALSQSGKVVANALTVTNTSTTTGAITLDLATNDVTSFGANNAALGNIVYRDATGFKIGATGINSRQNIQLTSVGDITQQVTGSIVGQQLSVTNLADTVPSNVTLGLPTNNVTSFVALNESPNGSVTLRTSGALTVGAAGVGIAANQGRVAVQSGGKMTLTANIDVGQDQDPATIRSRVNLTATGGINQTAGTFLANDVVVVNNGVGEITLVQSGNDVDRFAATNTGNVSYTDVDSFETGVLRLGTPGDQIIEVSTAGTLLLQAGTSAKDSLRVVGGLRFGVGKLFLAAGSTAAPGMVEYVTTSKGNGGATFSGSLRDMIGYANVNQARFGGIVAPQSIVFDAGGYAIDDITIAAALPAISQRVTVDGTRVESSLAANPRVGIKASGAAVTGNGLLFAAGAAGSTAQGLAITGFTKGAGIQLQGANNTVTNTFLGVQRDGVTLAGNQYGVDLNIATATGNVIGGAAVNFGVPDDTVANVIGGNTLAGVMVRGGAAGNTVRGNYIGTDSTDAALGNVGSGVQIFSTGNTLVSENVIARNIGDGVFINSSTATAITPNRVLSNEIRNQAISAGIRVANSAFATIGGSGLGNVVGLNNVGVQIENKSSSITVAGNFVGTDAMDTNLGNTTHGVLVINSVNNTIGGATSDLGNTSAFNGGTGFVVRNSFATTTAPGNRLLSNTADQNAAHGVLIDGGGQNTIGGATAGNIATRNGGDGIRVQSFVNGTTKFLSTANQILGNLVGTDSRVGNVDLGNAGDGIAIVEGSANVVNLGNVSRFNAQNGLRVEASSSNVIGSDIAGEGNTFSDNLVNGITVTGGAGNGLTRGNLISGNTIQSNGINPGSTTTGVGILVTGSRTTETVIGTRVANGRLVGVPNQIFENLGFGVSVVGGAQNTQIQSNSIYDNTLGSINRAAGTNANVAAPVISSAVVRNGAATGAQVVVTGTVAGTLRQQVAIDVYSTPSGAVDPALPASGRVYLGRFTVTITNVAGTAFTATLPILSLAAGDLITATATTLTVASGSSTVSTPIGSTSAMSAAVQLVLPTTVPSTAPTSPVRRV
jgi:hypothetical protein